MNEMLMNTVEEAESGLRKPGRSGWNEADSYIYTIAKTEEGKSAKGKAASVAKEERKIVPLFFATDDNYLPFLAVTIKSMFFIRASDKIMPKGFCALRRTVSIFLSWTLRNA